jgi:hypothetical protein
MKKLLVLFSLMATMVACTGNSTKSVEVTTDSDSVVVVDSVITDSVDSVK